MLKASRTVTIKQAEKILNDTLQPGMEYDHSQLKDILKKEFPGINNNQCSSLIHRSHSKEDGVLLKIEKNYQLRGTLHSVKSILQHTLKKIENIPMKRFSSAEEFEKALELTEKVKQMLNNMN